MEGDAGTSRLNPPGVDPDTSDQSDAESDRMQDQPTAAVATDGVDEQVVDDAVARRPERFGSGWLVAICLALLVLTAARLMVVVGEIRPQRASDEVPSPAAGPPRHAESRVDSSRTPPRCFYFYGEKVAGSRGSASVVRWTPVVPAISSPACPPCCT